MTRSQMLSRSKAVDAGDRAWDKESYPKMARTSDTTSKKNCKSPCFYCKAKFFDAASAKRHEECHHENIAKFRCDLCQKETGTLYDMKSHLIRGHKVLIRGKLTISKKLWSKI